MMLKATSRRHLALIVTGIALLSFTTTSCAADEKNSAGQPGAEPPAVVTFIELGSVNCIPCRAMQPVMKNIEGRYKGKVKVVFYDVWTPEGQPFGAKYRIRVIPTQVFLDKDGKEFFRNEGFLPEKVIDDLLARHGLSQ